MFHFAPIAWDWRQRHFVDIAIYKCNYCGNDWQIWVTLITWTWCLGDWLENIIFVWMKMNLNLNMNTWKWMKMKLNLTWTWKWSILVTKSVNEHTIWIRIIAWMWSGIAFKRLSEHELEPTWNILATNVEMSEDKIKLNHVQEHKLFLQLLWKQVKKKIIIVTCYSCN